MIKTHPNTLDRGHQQRSVGEDDEVAKPRRNGRVKSTGMTQTPTPTIEKKNQTNQLPTDLVKDQCGPHHEEEAQEEAEELVEEASLEVAEASAVHREEGEEAAVVFEEEDTTDQTISLSEETYFLEARLMRKDHLPLEALGIDLDVDLDEIEVRRNIDDQNDDVGHTHLTHPDHRRLMI